MTSYPLPSRVCLFSLTEEVLPEPFRSLFRGSWHYYDHITLALYSNDDLRAIWPEYACEERT